MRSVFLYMRTTLLLFTLFLANMSGAQTIAGIKTDQDCLAFIRKSFEWMRNFSFDTTFTPAEVQKLGIKEKVANWGKTDFDNDGQPDLYFVGVRKDGLNVSYEAWLFLTKDNPENELTKLYRTGEGNTPLIFHRSIEAGKLIFIYMFNKSGMTKGDSLVAFKKNLYPKGIRAIDTLVYKHDRVINFVTKPSLLAFDSLVIDFKDRYMEGGYRFTVYKDGSARRAEQSRVKKLRLAGNDLELLKNLVKEIDIVNTRPEYSGIGKDLLSAHLTIYDHGKALSFYDYGMESTFTLKAIYDFFADMNDRHK